MISCPLCNADIDVDEDELDEGDPLVCDECGASLTVTGLNPVELVAEDDDEDDDEEDDDFENEDEDEDDDDDKEEW